MATVCARCKGSGRISCKTCGGVGSSAGVPLGVEAMLQPCPACEAKGTILCLACHGSGTT